MAYEIDSITAMPHSAFKERLAVGEKRDFHRMVDLSDGEQAKPQDLSLEIIEVREKDYICKVVSLL
ncbi:hypothetical protein [Halomonas cerina]|uniref:Uncharacterized protein n=1 Tax=Halomonas cerina TaxID=447424 RepID=A0A839VHE2_9GAMM|nr:hypothetical protein [Halomonas cerina]MBB3192034.1 hypothetical protein [Halomonas cerina]